MFPNKSLPRRLVHGFVFQYTSQSGSPSTSRRWAYVDGDNLFLFPDSVNSNLCYRVYLKDSSISVIDEDSESPWITIAEKNMATYFIQPEKLQYFDSWLATLKRASINPLKFAPSGRISPKPDLQPRSTGGRPSVDENSATTGSHNSSLVSKDRVTGLVSYVSQRSPYRREPQSSFLGSGAPPRPPRSSTALHGVKEHPKMSDNDVNLDKPFQSIPGRYPGSGVTKRMSITASDLRGKSRDELMLLLLQLNREKANLQRWQDYFMHRIEVLNDPNTGNPNNDEDIAAIQVELNDVSKQLALSEPLVVFLSNVLRMGDLYAGDDAMFASEYKRHLFHEDDLIPARPSIVLARELEARDVARTLNASVQDFNGFTNPSRSTDMEGVGNSLASWLDYNHMVQPAGRKIFTQNLDQSIPQPKFKETEEARKERLRLEAELSDLEAICHSHGALHRQLRDIQKSLRQRNIMKGTNSVACAVDQRGPSATLLSKLRSDPGYRPSRSRSSDQHRSSQSPAQFMNSPFTRHSALGRQSAGTSINSLNIVNSSTRRNNLRRFQSIPENLNLISQPGNRLVRDNAMINLNSDTQGSSELTLRQSKSESRGNTSHDFNVLGSRRGTLLQENTLSRPLHVDTFQCQSVNEPKPASSLRPSVKPRNSSFKPIPGSSLRSGGPLVNNAGCHKRANAPPSIPSDTSNAEDLSLDDTFNNNTKTWKWKATSDRQVREAHSPLKSSQSLNWVTKQSSSMQKNEDHQQFTEESIESVFYAPEPIVIAERYIPSPPSFDSEDSVEARTKEKCITSLRKMVLLWSSINFPNELIGSGSVVDKTFLLDSCEHSVTPSLIFAQEQLAQQAAAIAVLRSQGKSAGGS